MTDTVLDAGALIALEQNARPMWAELKRAAQAGVEVVVPTTALAQVWRGEPSQAQLARALAQCSLAPFDPLARHVGELCGASGTQDVCDAHVALVAAARGANLFTSDPHDLRRLLASLGARSVRIIRC